MTQNITPIDPNADREPSPEVRFLNPETQAQTSETQISPKTPLTLQQKAERRIARLFEDYSESMTHYQEMLKSNKMGWETFFSDMERNIKNADKLSPEEQIVALSFFGIGLAIKRSKDRKLWEREFVRAIGERTKLQERKKQSQIH